MTILVTGSAGHLGEAMVRRLREQGRAVRGVDIKPSAFTDHVGSIADEAFVRDAMAGATAVIHSATLHKPHVATHSKRQFVDTNVAGTVALLEAAVAHGVGAFVFTSTTSAFGAALSPAAGEPAAWIDEDVAPIPKNIYGATKIAAEGMCELVARKDGLPVLVLRTSRFFPEDDDNAGVRAEYGTANLQANELLYRRADIDDIVTAHLLAIDKAPALRFGRYIVSAPPPFTRVDVAALRADAPAVVRRLFPDVDALYAAQGWKLLPSLDRVYDSSRAVHELGWRPKRDFAFVLDCLRRGEEFRSPMALAIGAKGYHDEVFAHGPYPVTP
ncbi:NAD-dependent epimerase/dehydratase family protein [Luteibacter aegosomatissinici]|uniref:NAD-dependent epimerase/dehydratase family protein n=1 Tax=Luteibacter aegosomatissinici TaxID=2911539 RepID=UPI001FF82B2A|nr:NAD(P)-dependent oxidoreductase [Luteibacter aegosomatissinici]UPG94709.1 NAD(P)-dependent oxidoreductase [Luteibacter aegosomatissinici]